MGKRKMRGGLTVEAALTVPLFLLAMAAVICLLDIYRIQAEVKTSLSESARELGMYAYAAETGSESPVGSVSTAVCALYGRQKLPDLGDKVQITLVRSSYKNHTVTLTADIFYSLPISFGPIRTIHLVNTAAAGAWVGNTEDRIWGGGSTGTEEMVYVTENESVYHTSPSCTHIHLSIHMGTQNAVKNMRNAYGERYQSCSKCQGDASQGTIYYSEKGNCYHSDSGCSGLKRTVRLVKKSEVSGKQICQRCGAREE